MIASHSKDSLVNDTWDEAVSLKDLSGGKKRELGIEGSARPL